MNISRLAILALAIGTLLPCSPAGAEQSGTFGVVTDIHFDPFDPPDLARHLAETGPEDWDAVFSTIAAQSAASYGADTNYALLRSALGALAELMAGTDFVIVPGDIIAHRFEEKAAAALGVAPDTPAVRSLAEKATTYVSLALRRALPGKPLVLGLGNNDSDCGDYRIEPAGPYLAATAPTVRALAGPDLLEPGFEETYRAGGYYAMRHPTVKNTVIIVINDTLWSPEYEDACGTSGDAAAEAMLAWLKERLAAAAAAGEWVWMVRHIPAGMDAYKTTRAHAGSCPQSVVPLLREPYATALPALMRQYADPVQASLSGHIHFDSYRLVTAPDGTFLDVEKIAPAISPIYGQNPGFQVFSYDLATGLPTDFQTWFLSDLDETSLTFPGTWKREYEFSEAYGQPEFSARTVAAMWEAAMAGGPDRETFARFYDVGHGALSAGSLPAFLCAMRFHDRDAFTACYCDGR